MDAIVAHHHCKVCGTAIPLEDPVCSLKCAQIRVGMQRQQRLYTLAFITISVILVVALLVKI